MIPDLCWVKQGVSKESPDVVKLNVLARFPKSVLARIKVGRGIWDATPHRRRAGYVSYSRGCQCVRARSSRA